LGELLIIETKGERGEGKEEEMQGPHFFFS
jgi:hypothetical protein